MCRRGSIDRGERDRTGERARRQRGQVGGAGPQGRRRSTHPCLAALLLLEQLLLARLIPPPHSFAALHQDVLSERRNTLASHNLRAHRGLNNHFNLLPLDRLLERFHSAPPSALRLLLRREKGKRIERLTVHQDVYALQVGLPQRPFLVVHARVAVRTPRNREGRGVRIWTGAGGKRSARIDYA